ncbi:MAG: EthD domain-containing protein [Betaproteobacteria bacterium]|nr:EthD domain-containing protein [Betaproteobacteria bacterium]
MFKLIRMMKRRPGLTPQQFGDELRRLDAASPDRVVVSLSTGEVALGGEAPPFDGMAAHYFATLEGARAAAGGVADAVVCDEHLMAQKPNPAIGLKIIRTVYRRRDLTHAEFKDYWLKNHSRLEDRVIAESPVQRIIASFAVPEPGRDPAFDGMVELYFRDVADIRAMFAGPIPAMMRKDEENFVQMDAPAVRLVALELASRGGL